MVVFSYRLKLPLNYFVLATLFLKYIPANQQQSARQYDSSKYETL